MSAERPAAKRASRRRRGELERLLDHTTEAGVDEALKQLVNQFADPLSFLRELVQNSIDAGSTRIEVDFALNAYGPESEGETDLATIEGIACVTVADNGEGMNETIIDKYLLTLFASSKENDLTKIGKFGIGFVSIFALEPDLVVLETGQTGEAWRLIFHADARYEKLRLDEPVEGTTVRLYRRMKRADFEELQARGREVIRHWCKYTEVEILVEGTPVREAFSIPALLPIHYQEPGTELLAGFTDHAFDPPAPVCGFYNRGLTLLEGPLPGPEEAFFYGLSLRLKSRYLEHTLTRDNVLQDENYEKAMALARREIEAQLRPRLWEHLQALARHHSGRAGEAAPDGPDIETSLALARLLSMDLGQHAAEIPVFPTLEGAPLSLRDLRRIKTPAGKLLVATRSNALTKLLNEQSVPVLKWFPRGLGELLNDAELPVAQVNEVLATAVRIEGEVEAKMEPMLELLARLLQDSGGRIERVCLGDLAYPDSGIAGQLFLRQERAFGLTLLGVDDRPTVFGGARDLVLNTSHPLVVRSGAIALGDAPLAALLLAQAVIAVEKLDADRAARLAGKTLAALAAASPSDGAGETHG